jgi:hypothetical protein
MIAVEKSVFGSMGAIQVGKRWMAFRKYRSLSMSRRLVDTCVVKKGGMLALSTPLAPPNPRNLWLGLPSKYENGR